MIIVLGSVVAHEGRRDEALALSEEHVARSRTEPGCIAHAAERLPRVDNDCRGLYKRSAASTRLQTNDPGEKKNMWWTRTLCTAGLIVFAGAAFAAESDEAAIRKQSIDWVKAYNAGDSAACAAEYTDDALLMAPGAPGVKGKTAIAAYLKKDIAGSKAAGATFELGPKADVGVSGNLGWESGTYKVTIKGAVVDAGKYLSVSVKKDGKWYYVRDTYNSDMAPPAPAPSK
jgi:ketosteroid isomerase-like protein